MKLALTISGADSSGAKEAKYIAARDNKTYGYLRTFGGGGIHDVGILKGTFILDGYNYTIIKPKSSKSYEVSHVF